MLDTTATERRRSITEILADPGLRSNSILRFFGERGWIPTRLLGRLTNRFEGGQMFSRTWRHILFHRYGVIVDAYSYGGLLHPGSGMAHGLEVGRYVSIAGGVQWPSDHPMTDVSMHPLKYTKKPAKKRLYIGHDAWIGVNAIITAKCNRIGIGAVVAAASVVTKDVPDFAIVAGVPARILRYRFDEEAQIQILASRWWEHGPEHAANISYLAQSSTSATR